MPATRRKCLRQACSLPGALTTHGKVQIVLTCSASFSCVRSTAIDVIELDKSSARMHSFAGKVRGRGRQCSPLMIKTPHN